MPDAGRFEFSVPVEKASGDDPWTFKGRASSTVLDRDDARMAQSAIESFQRQLHAPITLGGSHDAVKIDVTSEVGRVERVLAGSDVFDFEGRFFDTHPYAPYVKARINDTEHPPNWKLSVGGRVPEGGRRLEWDTDLGKTVMMIEEMLLDHILLCRGDSAINQDTFVGPVSGKASEDWADAVFKAAAETISEPTETDAEVLSAEYEDCESIGKALSDKPWGDVDKSKLPKECFLYVGDPELKSTWKFPVYEGGGSIGKDGTYNSRGSLNRNALAAAANRLAQTDEAVRRVVEPKLRGIYKQNEIELPPSLNTKKAEGTLEDTIMAEETRTEETRTPEDERVSVGTIERLATFLSGMLGGEAAKAEAPTEEPAPDEGKAAPAYVTADEVKAIVAEQMDTFKAELVGEFQALVEKAPPEEQKAEAPVEEAKPAEEEKAKTPEAETPAEEPAPNMLTAEGVVKALVERIDELGKAVAHIQTQVSTEEPGASAQIELTGKAGNRDKQGGEPPLLTDADFGGQFAKDADFVKSKWLFPPE